MNSKEFWDTNYCGRQLIFRWYFIFEGKVMTVTTFDDDDPKCPELLNRFLHHFSKSKCLAKNQNMILFWKEKNGTSKAMCFQWRDLCFQIDSKEYIPGSYLGFLPKSDKRTPFGGKSLKRFGVLKPDRYHLNAWCSRMTNNPGMAQFMWLQLTLKLP